MPRFLAALIMIILAGSLSANGWAAKLPIPRYVSLGASEVNMRAGPGAQYPVIWVYVRHGLPVEVVGEFEYWLKVRDVDGTEGWIHKSLLSGRRMGMVTGDTQPAFRMPKDGAAPVFRAEAGVQVRLLRCQGAWCQIEARGLKGWMRREQLYGVYPDETIE